MGFQIAILSPNTFSYSENDLNLKRLAHQNIEDDIEDYITFETVNDAVNLEEMIRFKLNVQENQIVTALRIYENDKDLYQLFCLASHDEEQENLNFLAYYLGDKNYRFFGNAIVMKTKIQSDRSCQGVSIQMRDIINVFREKFVHIGIQVDAYGNVKEYEFVHNPFDIFHGTEEYKKMAYYEHVLFNQVLQIFVEMEPKNRSLVNHKASLICRREPIVGTVLFALRKMQEDLREDTYTYMDFTIEEFNKILTISYNKKMNIPFEDKKMDPTSYSEYLDQKKLEVRVENFYLNLNTLAFSCKESMPQDYTYEYDGNILFNDITTKRKQEIELRVSAEEKREN